MTFFNTINEVNPILAQYKEEAQAQEAVILRLFENGEKMTPLEVERRTGINHDSVKRAITCLTRKGKLVKLDEKVMEVRGKKNHLWILNENK